MKSTIYLAKQLNTSIPAVELKVRGIWSGLVCFDLVRPSYKQTIRTDGDPTMANNRVVGSKEFVLEGGLESEDPLLTMQNFLIKRAQEMVAGKLFAVKWLGDFRGQNLETQIRAGNIFFKVFGGENISGLEMPKFLSGGVETLFPKEHPVNTEYYRLIQTERLAVRVAAGKQAAATLDTVATV